MIESFHFLSRAAANETTKTKKKLNYFNLHNSVKMSFNFNLKIFLLFISRKKKRSK